MRHGKIHYTLGVKNKLSLIAASLCLVVAAVSQSISSSSSDVAETVTQLKEGKRVQMWQLEEIATFQAKEAIPLLRRNFAHTDDLRQKGKIAEILVRLGVKEPIYWSYLEKQAIPAVDSDAPSTVSYGLNGKIVPSVLSTSFIAWANEHNESIDVASNKTMQEFPSALYLLADTGDPRGKRLLLRALRSPNYLISAIAAQGLAKIGDVDSVAPIVEACKTAPLDAQLPFAMALLAFHSKAARQAALPFLPTAILNSLQEKDTRQK